MTTMKAKIQQSGKLKGRAQSQQEIIAKSASLTSALSLGDLTDVDVSGQTDGVMMIFDGDSGSYKVTTQIQNDNLNIIGGTYQYG